MIAVGGGGKKKDPPGVSRLVKKTLDCNVLPNLLKKIKKNFNLFTH